MQMEVRSRADGSWGIVEVEGEVDMATAPRLKDALAETMEAGHDRIVVDLGTVTFMDSSGLEALVETREALEAEGGELVLIADDGRLDKLLEIVGLEFPVYGSVADVVGGTE